MCKGYQNSLRFNNRSVGLFLGGGNVLDEPQTRLSGIIVLDQVVRASNSKESVSHIGRTRQRRISAANDG